jgi:hypothetical protein
MNGIIGGNLFWEGKEKRNWMNIKEARTNKEMIEYIGIGDGSSTLFIKTVPIIFVIDYKIKNISFIDSEKKEIQQAYTCTIDYNTGDIRFEFDKPIPSGVRIRIDFKLRTNLSDKIKTLQRLLKK